MVCYVEVQSVGLWWNSCFFRDLESYKYQYGYLGSYLRTLTDLEFFKYQYGSLGSSLRTLTDLEFFKYQYGSLGSYLRTLTDLEFQQQYQYGSLWLFREPQSSVSTRMVLQGVL